MRVFEFGAWFVYPKKPQFLRLEQHNALTSRALRHHAVSQQLGAYFWVQLSIANPIGTSYDFTLCSAVVVCVQSLSTTSTLIATLISSPPN